MKKEVIIYIIIGIIVGILIGYLVSNTFVENISEDTKRIIGNVSGVFIWSHIGIEKTFEGVKVIEFEVNGVDNNMGGFKGCMNGVCGDAAVFLTKCEYYMGENFGGEGVYAPDLEFYTCRLEGVKFDVDTDILTGECKCYYKLKT